MLWAIDVGNTMTKVGWSEGGSVGAVGFLSQPTGEPIGSLLERVPGSGSEFGGVASVVPAENEAIAAELDRRGVPFRFLTGLNAPGLEIRYETKETLGADRIANALALSESGGLPAIGVDFGTATKIDVVDASGAYLGGAILPSAEMMMEALTKGTALLPEISLTAPDRAIGRTTEASLQSGTVLALAKAVEGLLSDFQVELGSEARIVATGGLGERYLPLCPSLRAFDPMLTLRGLFIAARRWADPHEPAPG